MNKISIEERARRYLLKTERVLKEIRVVENPTLIDGSRVLRVIEEANRYFEDAKYYFERKEYEVSLVSISYCEGLLDALRMLKLAEFEW
ncbi:MAG: DUF357 domain-containing protein [Candidatus Bathyarchaeia archaeon]|nr:DUF357 domain-containing protein [Candidatus Bathyarchaeota archaeon]